MRKRLCGNCGERFDASADRCPSCGTHSHRPQADGEQRQQATCIAHGCPLPGTVCDDTKGGGPWMCSAHRHARSEQWQEVTGRIREVDWVWRALNRLATEGHTDEFEAQVSRVCQQRGFGDWARSDLEEPAQWVYRLRLAAVGYGVSGRRESAPRHRDGPPVGGSNIGEHVGRAGMGAASGNF